MSLLDAHVHVWDTGVLEYPWLEQAPDLPGSCLPHQIDRADSSSTRMIFVEAGARPDQALAEAQWVNRYPTWAELVGIVAACDLRAGEATVTALDALESVGRLVGVRHNLQDEPADHWQPGALAEGLEELVRRDLTFDACVRCGQLTALAELLERVPEAQVVVDHLGKPPVDEGLASERGRAWRADIGRLAALPNVWVKVSGLAAEATDPDAYARHADAFIAAAVEAFGTDRAMIGSDWPVSRHTGAGTLLSDWVTRVRHATGASGDEWSDLAEDSAARFYGIL